jgi:hypothetical protein
MKTLYEVLNVDLAQEYTKARKLAKLEKISVQVGTELETEAKAAIAAMDIPEDDDRYHWIQSFGKAAGADLLTLGKVQPENMLKMASLGNEDFQEAVKVATRSARTWNQNTITAEKELNAETIPSTMV